MMQTDTVTGEDRDRAMGQVTAVANTPTLLFFHIGKTGGTSLTRYFRSLARDYYVQPSPEDCSRLEAWDDTEFPDFISGHYKVDAWLHRLPASWRTMVVIRNPIQHLLSSYWHIRTHPDVNDDPALCELIETARRYDLSRLLDWRAGECFEMHFDNPQTRFILNKESGSLDADDQTHAIALLGSITHVGTTERLHEFAAQVAASMPWAIGRDSQILPRAMVNPLNALGTDEIPRPLLRRILAATEIDAALHLQAQRLRSERATSRASVAVRPKPASPCPGVRAIPVADLIRVFPLQLQNVRMGHELCIDDDEIILHPPVLSERSASVTIEDIPLDGHSELSGRLMLAHEQAAAVLFGIELSQGDVTCASASFKIMPGQPLDIRLRFRTLIGCARLVLRTEMAATHSNDFAWATFIRLTMR
jgi:Sulfotransferase family